jgi:DNA primase
LLESHAEEFAHFEFLNPDADLLRRAILDAGAGHEIDDPEVLRSVLAGRGLGSVLTRLDAAITHASDWPAREGAAADDVAQFWTQIVTLHRKVRTLNKELKDAQLALGENSSEANWARFLDVRDRLSAIDGTEASIEGFGASSGRPARSL